jgi:parallel beta-helix repeat protein
MPTGKPLAEIEPRVAVNDENTPGHSTASFIITKAASYYLSGNVGVGSESVGVLIEASNVTLDLNGFSIIGKDSTTSAAGVAVASGCSDVAVVNGFIAECRHAVLGEEADARMLVRNVHARNTQNEAFFLPQQSVVEDCTLVDSGGIVVGDHCRVSRCVVLGGGYVGIATGGQCVVEDNQVSQVPQEGISTRTGSIVEGNVVQSCGSGIRVGSGSNTLVRSNDVLNNTGIGLRADTAGNTVSGNTVRGNGTNYQFVAGNHLELLISQIPQTLSWPCVATLQGRLVGVAGQNGITISGENVTVDLAGHELQGAGGTPNSGIAVVGAWQFAVVRNGTVSGWLGHGVDFNDSFGSTIEDVAALGCGQFGIRSGIASRVKRCRIQGCQSGIRAREKANVTDCRVDSCEQGGIELVASAVAERNDLRGNEGAAIHAVGSGSIVRDNIVVDGFGTGLKASAGGNTFSGNIVRGNVVNYDFVAGNQLDLLISQIPQTLSWPCKATLTGTLTGVADQHGITVASDAVAIDLGGHTLVGGGGSEFRSGINVDAGATRKAIMVRNGTLRGWRSSGISAPIAAPLVVEDVVAVGNSIAGFELSQSIVTMTRCAAHDSPVWGFITTGGGTFIQCSAINCGIGFALSGDSTMQDCKATSNSDIGISLSGGGVVTNSTASYNNGPGFIASNAIFTACFARNNQTGFELNGGSVSGCHALANIRNGIVAQRTLILANNLTANGGILPGPTLVAGGIYARNNCRIEGNDCRDNARGIVVDGAPDPCIVIRNTCVDNGTNWEIGPGNAVAPIVQATTNAAAISGNTYAGNLGSTDPNANFTY